jgi:hypothetical protein
MDAKTLLHYSEAVGEDQVQRTLPIEFVSANLTAEEGALWETCAVTHIRLEQENIPAEFSARVLGELVEDKVSIS